MEPARRLSDPRGEHTRQRILETAIKVFASVGYAGASTRALATQAGVNQPAIQYHFDSKEGLYCAAVAQIAAGFRHAFDAPRAKIETALKSGGVPETELKSLLFEMLDTFSGCIFDNARDQEGLFIARAEIENQDTLQVLGEAIVDCMVKPCATLVGRLLSRPAEDEEVLIRTLAILGQVINFKNRCLGKAIRHSLGWRDFGDDQKRSVMAIVREQTEAILAAAQKKAPSTKAPMEKQS